MQNKIPLSRMNKFLSNDDFNLDISLGEEYLHGDLNFKLVLFRVDTDKTNNDSIYAEANKDNISFFPPIEFNALVRFEEPKNDAYKDGIIRFNEPGNLIVSVYTKHLKEKGIDINYGDFIGYPESEDNIRYYQVTNDGKVTSDSKHIMLGLKAFYRTITCVPAQQSLFRGI